MKLKGFFTKSEPLHFSSNPTGEMSDWEKPGAFPSSKDIRPIMEDMDDMDDSENEGLDPIFSDEGFDGEFETLSNVNLATHNAKTTRHESLMTLSHGSSETPAVSNTTTSLVRKAVTKNRLGNEGRTDRVHPYGGFRTIPEESNETPGKKEKAQKKYISKASPSPPPHGKPPKPEQKQTIDKDYSARSPAASITALLTPAQDEPSSVITGDDHQQEPNQFIYDYMAEGTDVEVMSVRSRRHGGGSKHHLARHTLPTSQKVTANPANMLNNLFISVEAERHMHRLTAQHMRAINNWILFLPSILLSLVAGLLVLIFEADIEFSGDAQIYSSIAVGVLSLVSVFWQAIYKQMDLGTKSALHNACSVGLKRISEDILLTMSAAETIPAEYVALIGEKYGQAADACPLTIPYKLEAAFSHLSDRMVLMLRPPLGQSSHTKPKSIDILRLYATVYDELSAEVINHFLFPFHLPNPRTASEMALKNFKAIIIEGKDKGRHGRWKSILCPCFRKREEDRSLFDILPAVRRGGSLGPTHSQRSF